MSKTVRDEIILASSSQSRKNLLKGAGVSFEAISPNVDEDEVKHSLQVSGISALETAVTLAELKASRISRQFPDYFVVGADQMLECGGVWFDKPPDMDHARAHLAALRGKTHSLHNAVCVVKAGQVIWHYVNEAKLEMRPFSDEFLEWYLKEAGEEILWSVGAYQLEATGSQLFYKVEGDFFSILGLPLLPLLDFLRNHKVVLT